MFAVWSDLKISKCKFEKPFERNVSKTLFPAQRTSALDIASPIDQLYGLYLKLFCMTTYVFVLLNANRSTKGDVVITCFEMSF